MFGKRRPKELPMPEGVKPPLPDDHRFIEQAAPIIFAGLVSRPDGSKPSANIELAVSLAKLLYQEIQKNVTTGKR